MSKDKPCQTGSQCISGKCSECEREWVGLTYNEMVSLIADVRGKEKKTYEEKFNPTLAILKNAEAKLKEKNT